VRGGPAAQQRGGKEVEIPEDGVQKLYEALKKLQEPKGYFFNVDTTMTTEILKGLLKNKARYGYMSCPCRLASGNRENDKDIICPCAYRKADVKEYGSCYCNLYVSREWNEGKIPHAIVPERRPPEKMKLR
jgi:ferredoxin-thioredoxin reductase catalytic subunit